MPPGSDAKGALSPIPKAFLLALVIFGLSEQLLWSYRPWLEFCDRYARPGSASDPLRTSARIRLLPKDEPAPPILLIGSSQVLEGLACRSLRSPLAGTDLPQRRPSPGAPPSTSCFSPIGSTRGCRGGC